MDGTARTAILVEPSRPSASPSAYIEVDDSSGAVAWSKTLGAEGVLAFDPTGNLYLVGASSGAVAIDLGDGAIATPATPSTILAKYDPNGLLVWSEFLPAFLLRTLSVDATGQVYVSGGINGTVDLGTGPLSGRADTSGGLDNILVAKFDPSGAAVWARVFHMSANADGGSLQGGIFPAALGFDATGALLLGGDFANVIDLGAGPMVSGGYSDGFFARLTQ